jgi:hypothetical protein
MLPNVVPKLAPLTLGFQMTLDPAFLVSLSSITTESAFSVKMTDRMYNFP